MELETKSKFMPRVKVLGGRCSVCSRETPPDDFLIKIHSVSQVGYLDSELCFRCLLGWKQSVLEDFMEGFIESVVSKMKK